MWICGSRGGVSRLSGRAPGRPVDHFSREPSAGPRGRHYALLAAGTLRLALSRQSPESPPEISRSGLRAIAAAHAGRCVSGRDALVDYPLPAGNDRARPWAFALGRNGSSTNWSGCWSRRTNWSGWARRTSGRAISVLCFGAADHAEAVLGKAARTPIDGSRSAGRSGTCSWSLGLLRWHQVRDQEALDAIDASSRHRSRAGRSRKERLASAQTWALCYEGWVSASGVASRWRRRWS